jgi:hypothetical protein
MSDTLNNVASAINKTKNVTDNIPVIGTIISWVNTGVSAAAGLFSRDANRSKPTWDETNAVTKPLAISLTDILTADMSASDISALIEKFVAYSVAFVSVSNHADTNTNTYYCDKLTNENATVTTFEKFQYNPYARLAQAVWLLAMWQFGNFSRDQFKDGTAAKQFYDLLQVTLFKAVREINPVAAVPVQAAYSNPVQTAAVAPVKSVGWLASLSGSTVVVALLVGAFVFMLVSSIGKK